MYECVNVGMSMRVYVLVRLHVRACVHVHECRQECVVRHI